MTTTAIVVGRGTLGRELERVLQETVPIVKVLTRPDIDITDPVRTHDAIVRCFDRNAKALTRSDVVVFNAAAYTAVDRAEEEARGAMEVNAIGAENVAAACARLGVALVHYSTDAVFPSACGQTELDVPTQTPSTWYGRSKLLGEQLVQRAHPSAYVLRVANLYGDGGRNWASGLRRTLLADSTDPAKVIADHGRRVAPTWARWVAEVSARLVEQRWSPGVYHVCARGDTTWAGFAKRMAAELGVEHNIRGHLLERRAPLGSEGRLTSLRLLAQQLDVPTWQQLLSRYVREEHDASQGEVPSV